MRINSALPQIKPGITAHAQEITTHSKCGSSVMFDIENELGLADFRSQFGSNLNWRLAAQSCVHIVRYTGRHYQPVSALLLAVA